MDLRKRGVEIRETIGGLDECPIAGIVAGKIIHEKYQDFDFAVISGTPHAVPVEPLSGMEAISITNGPRQVLPIHEMGDDAVVVEIDETAGSLAVEQLIRERLASKGVSVIVACEECRKDPDAP